MLENFLKEYRCKNCNKLFFKGDVHHAIIEIKCRNCKQISKIETDGCKLWLLSDEKAQYKNSEGKTAIEQAILSCDTCPKVSTCARYLQAKRRSGCPLCGKN